MNGESSWIDVIVVFGGALLLLVGLGIFSFRKAAMKRQMSFVCPNRKILVDATLVQDPGTRAYYDVEKCSAFDDPNQVTCKQDCCRKLNQGIPLQATSVNVT